MSSGSSYIDYSAFAGVMAENYPEYSWNTITTFTADDYELSNFKIWNEEKRDPEKGWVFFQHGGTMSGTNWIYHNSKTNYWIPLY